MEDFDVLKSDKANSVLGKLSVVVALVCVVYQLWFDVYLPSLFLLGIAWLLSVASGILRPRKVPWGPAFHDGLSVSSAVVWMVVGASWGLRIIDYIEDFIIIRALCSFFGSYLGCAGWFFFQSLVSEKPATPITKEIWFWRVALFVLGVTISSYTTLVMYPKENQKEEAKESIRTTLMERGKTALDKRRQMEAVCSKSVPEMAYWIKQATKDEKSTVYPENRPSTFHTAPLVLWISYSPLTPEKPTSLPDTLQEFPEWFNLGCRKLRDISEISLKESETLPPYQDTLYSYYAGELSKELDKSDPILGTFDGTYATYFYRCEMHHPSTPSAGRVKGKVPGKGLPKTSHDCWVGILWVRTGTRLASVVGFAQADTERESLRQSAIDLQNILEPWLSRGSGTP
jgi:hypothetical protein